MNPTTTAYNRLKNRKQLGRGCILLLQRGGGNSFADKAWRALQDCPGVAVVVIGNNDRENPHALFAMPGAWPPRTAPGPTPTAAGAAAAAATASMSAAAGGPASLEAPPVPVLMISYAAFQEVRALLKLEGEFAGGAAAASSASRLLLHVRLEALAAPSPEEPGIALLVQRLQSFELGPAIRQAVRANDHELLRALLRQTPEEGGEDEEDGAKMPPAYAEAEPYTGLTVLHMAIDANAVECLGQLLQRPGIAAVLDAPNSRGRRPVHMAAGQDRDLALALILAAGAYIDAPDDALGWTALHFAARAGALAALQTLVRAGATLDYRGYDGTTPFVVAVHSGHAAAAEALLSAGANPFLPNLRGKRAADCSVPAAAECAQLMARYEQQAVSSGRPVPGGRADFFHWSAAPWLSMPVAAAGEREGLEALVRLAAEEEENGQETAVRVACFAASAAMPSMTGGGKGACRAILPTALLLASLREELADQHPAPSNRGFSKRAEAEDLMHQLGVLGQAAPSDATAVIVRAVSRAARASWAAGLPPLATRGGLAVVELPGRCRRALWLGALTGQAADGAAGLGAVEEGWLCQGSPVRSPAIGERVRCLFEDLRRTRIPAYCSGPGMDRVRRLILLWLRRDQTNDYRQGLTFMTCPILETFQREHGQREQEQEQGW
jgi:ankyrin repeat protein